MDDFTSKIFFKNDGLAGKKIKNHKRIYGGNKPRKLEFIGGKILEKVLNGKKIKTIITTGCVGSNHACAVSYLAKLLNLKSKLFLLPQPNSEIVKKNILFRAKLGAETILFDDFISRDLELKNVLEKDKKGSCYFIPSGGSTPLGVIGYINAMFELKDQIDAGIIPIPDYIYVPVGSFGTYVGLLIGAKILNRKDKNFKTKIIGVLTYPIKQKDYAKKQIEKLFYETNGYLMALDDGFKSFLIEESDINIRMNSCGEAYGLETEDGKISKEIFKKLEEISLEQTYTAKCAAAMMNDLIQKEEFREQKIILYWNTFCDYTKLENDYLEYDINELSKELKKYF